MSDLKQPLEPEAAAPPVTPPSAEYPPTASEGSAADAPEDARWVKAYGSARDRLPPSLSSRLPTSEEAKASVDSLSARFASSSAEHSESFKARKAKLRSDLLSHGYSVANATEIPLYISLNQVGPLMYEAVEPNGVFERRAPGLFFLLEVRASGEPYTPWSVAWPILAVTGPAVALTSLLAIPFAAAVTGSAALAGMGTAVMSGIASASSAIATTAARVALLPGGKKLHGKLVSAANSHIASLKDKGTQEVLRYVTVAVAAVKSKLHKDGKEHLATEKEEIEAEEPAKVIAEIDVTGYPLEKVLTCKTGKRKLDSVLEAAFKKLDFKTKDFQPKTDPVLRVVGGPRLDERGGKTFLVFHPLTSAEPLPTDEKPPTAEEERLAHDARVVDTWEEASVSSSSPLHAGEEDEKKRSWLDSWRKKK
ncbi:hypothetical protein A1Q1_07431 [Trichosporon asahii var. asahii CBS 2479]|uniref:Uncharacterized protein n=1 Tax=Trichosporon asahii var. asahii (strain ATCC 90039 / CBS 2479 / JCM 2466 / KCTC 7840 / NBRC 103889/ NCYC 2677 / UAMH 7654) TaxID=1186058 RepID=J6F392_TRIAS|nr:hypothetical protein A1Q1_07431 [Trichosporon asahii var. asahii CBS 2479]EJT51459.1 hypothetical protein A1Q1_07431 [Trichosporon asahii var. asahii CBS 2479]